MVAHIHIDELSKAGIAAVDATEEWVVIGGKIKSLTITAAPASVEELKRAGFNTGVANQGQGGGEVATSTVAPSSVGAAAGAPATGFGAISPDTGRLTLPMLLVT